MNEMMAKAIAERIMITYRVERLYKDEEIFKNNKRLCPYFSERKGMEMMLKTIGVEYEYTFDDETYEINGITVAGVTVMA